MASFNAGQTGGNESEAANVLRSQGIQNPSSGLIRYVAYGSQDYGLDEARQYGLPQKAQDIQAEQTRLRQEAIRPAIESLQASRPEATKIYTGRQAALEAERAPTLERYQNLIAELKGREGRELATTGKNLSTEYGKRGISLSSGAYQQDLAGKQADTGRFYGTQTKDVSLAQEADVRDLDNMLNELTNSHVQTLRAIDNKIAELQAGAGNQAATDALTMIREQEQRKFESRFDDLDKKIKEASLNQQADPYSQYKVLGEGQSIFDLSTLSNIFKNPKTYKVGDSSSDDGW